MDSSIILFSQAGFEFILRWLHLFFGVMWIGHLYYFNMTQMNIMPKADAATKSGITRVLLPEALWWFRWGAMWTMVTGVVYLGIIAHQMGGLFFQSGYGIAITSGAVFGLIMWANVWFVIWPNQKVVIASAEQVAGGGQAIAEAAAAASTARLVSRTNTLFSIPMLFFMGAAKHLPIIVSDQSKFSLYWILFAVVVLAIELNALKFKKEALFTTIKNTIIAGFALSLLVYFVMEICL